jgi:hypothetical protein
MDISVCVDMLRSIAFLWVGVESTILAYLYFFGFSTYKRSSIIKVLDIVFVVLGITSFYMAFLPILGITNPGYRDIANDYLTVLLVPLALSLSFFRHESTNSNPKNKNVL